MRIRTPSYSYTTVRRDLAPAGENARCRDVPWVASRWVGSCHEGGVTAYHSRCPARLSPSSSLCVTLPNGGYRYQLWKIRIFRRRCSGPPSPPAPHPAGCRHVAHAAGRQVARFSLALLACLAREPVFGCGRRPRCDIHRTRAASPIPSGVEWAQYPPEVWLRDLGTAWGTPGAAMPTYASFPRCFTSLSMTTSA